jgi:SSS family solute:Na+ symporter
VVLTSFAASATLHAANRLISLAAADSLVIVIYFAMVLGIGVHLKCYSNTSNDFFTAGREMSAWLWDSVSFAQRLGRDAVLGI